MGPSVVDQIQTAYDKTRFLRVVLNMRGAHNLEQLDSTSEVKP